MVVGTKQGSERNEAMKISRDEMRWERPKDLARRFSATNPCSRVMRPREHDDPSHRVCRQTDSFSSVLCLIRYQWDINCQQAARTLSIVRTLNNFKPRPVNALPYSFIWDRILEWLRLFFPSEDRDRGWLAEAPRDSLSRPTWQDSE